MEINQKLFDECTQNYKKERMRERELLNQRDSIWCRLEEIASSNPSYGVVPHENNIGAGSSLSATDDDNVEPNLYERLEGAEEVFRLWRFCHTFIIVCPEFNRSIFYLADNRTAQQRKAATS